MDGFGATSMSGDQIGLGAFVTQYKRELAVDLGDDLLKVWLERID